MARSILVVDDEKLLSWGLRVNLEKEGFHVVEAQDGNDALTLLSQKEKFGLLITDYLMEGMNGDQLMRQARKMNEDLKVIMFSGSSQEKCQGSAEFAEKPDFFLGKPIDFETLVAAIKRMMVM